MRAPEGPHDRFVTQSFDGPVRNPITKRTAERLRVGRVSKHPPEQGNARRDALRPIEQPLDLLDEIGDLGLENVSGHRIPVGSRFYHERRNVLNDEIVLIDLANEGLPFPDVVLLIDPSPDRRILPPIEGGRNGAEARSSHRVATAGIPQEVPPSPHPARRAVVGPGKHYRSGAGDNHEATFRPKRGVKGNASVVHNLHVQRLCLVREPPSEPIGKRLLFVGTARPRYPCTNGEPPDGAVRLDRFSHQGGEGLG